MVMRILMAWTLLLTFDRSFVRGDGLIYTLPPDGSWATYAFRQHGTEISTLKGDPIPDILVEGSFTVRSVGVETTEQGKARWIELESRCTPTKEHPVGRIIVIKTLIPERSLRAGVDPLIDVREIYFIDRGWALDREPEKGKTEFLQDPERVRYEIERLRKAFPFAPKGMPAMQSHVDFKSPVGPCQATKLTYPVDFVGKLTGGKGGRWRWHGDYTLWLAEQSPFGVVAVETKAVVDEEYATADKAGVLHLNGEGVRMKSVMRLELKATGMGAKSAIP